MKSLIQNLRFSLRQIRRAPGFMITAVLTLALGVGANTAIFSLLDQALLRSLPVRDPEKLVMVYEHFRGQGAYNPVAPGDFLGWRAKTHGFEEMAAWQHWSFNLSGEHDEMPEVARAAAIHQWWPVRSRHLPRPVRRRSMSHSWRLRRSAIPPIAST